MAAEKLLQKTCLQEWLQKEMLLKIAANKGYLRENCCKNGSMHIKMAAEKLLRKWLHTKMAAAEDAVVDAGMAAKRDAAENCCEQRISARKLLQKWLHIKNGCGKTTAEMAAYKNGCCRRRLLMQEWLQKEMLLKIAANKGYLQENCCKNGCI